MKQGKVFTYGRHALSEALKYAPQAVTKVYLDPKMADTKIRRQIEAANIPIAKLSEGMARSDMKSGTPHQGIIGSISVAQLMVPYEKFITTLQAEKGKGVVLLSGVQDPQNVGAIIRSAAGFGVAAVLLPEKGQAQVSGAIIKVSAGMAFRIPLVQVPSAERAAADLKKKGFTVYALSGEGASSLPQERFESPAVFILGNEAEGISAGLRAQSDKVLSIPLDPRCESLNVAAAAAVVLYSWSTRG